MTIRFGMLTGNAAIDCALLAWFLAQLAKVVLELALGRYADGLGCRQKLAIMAQRTGHGELLTGEKR